MRLALFFSSRTIQTTRAAQWGMKGKPNGARPTAGAQTTRGGNTRPSTRG
ncbi:MAG: hypothetical protein PUI88_03590 [Prevotella sp.]|nr:hypothetical protein [Prevotella sp.]